MVIWHTLSFFSLMWPTCPQQNPGKIGRLKDLPLFKVLVTSAALVVYMDTIHATVVNFDCFWFLHGLRWNNMVPSFIHTLLH